MAKYIEEILEAELRRLAVTEGMNAVTVTGLVKNTGINRKTFYNHFSGIGDMLRRMLRSGFRQTVSGNTSPYTWDIAVRSCMNAMRQNRDFLEAVFSSKYGPEARETLRREIDLATAGFVQQAKRILSERSGRTYILSADQEGYLVMFYSAMLSAMMQRWFAGGMKESIQEFVTMIGTLTEDTIYAGIAAFDAQEK
jgi:AcrR family transcriptional regulator